MDVQQDEAMARARTRARKILQLYSHVTIYVLVCAMLVVIDLATGSSEDTLVGLDWAYWPILGWGIGVALHASSLVVSKSSSWEERKAQALYEKARQRESEPH